MSLEAQVAELANDVIKIKKRLNKKDEIRHAIWNDLQEELLRLAREDHRRMVVMEGDIGLLKQDMTEVKQDVSDLKDEVSGVKQDVAGLKQDMIEVKQDVSGLKQEMSGVKQEMVDIKQEFKQRFLAVDERFDQLEQLIRQALVNK